MKIELKQLVECRECLTAVGYTCGEFLEAGPEQNQQKPKLGS